FATLVTDITERRAGEAVLRRYQLLSEHTHDSLLFLRAADGRIIEANRAALEAYGYTADEIRARRIHDLRAPHTLPEIDRQLAEAQENTLSFETVHRRRDGREFPVEVHVIHAVLDAEPILLSTVRDITARRAIEAALRESEARFRGLAETAPDAILVADAAGRLLFFNPAAEAIFGYAPAEVLGRLVQTWLPAEPRAAADDPAPMLAALGAVLNHTVELLGRRKSGEAFPLELSLTRVQTANGEVFTSIIRDISERKRIEATLRLQSAALNAAANAIVITNRAGAIEWVNPAFSALTGYPFAAAIHHTPRLLKSGRHAPEFYQALWETIAAGRIWSGELVNRRQDGQLYDEEQTITPVLDETGRITHFVAIKQDISVRKQRERELEAVARLSSALRGAVNRAAMPAIILDQVARLLEARGTALALHEEATPDGQQQFGFGEWVDFTNLQFPPDEAIMRHVLETGRPYIQDDIRQDPRFYHGLKVADLYAVICLPMLAQRQMIGTLWAARPKPFHDADVRVLASLAEIAANALHRAALHEQTVQRLSQLQALRQVDRAITSNLDARLTLEVLLEQVAAQLGVDAADILLLDPQWQTLTLAGSRGWRGRPFAGPVTLDTVGPGPALLERRLIVLPDLTATPLAGERAADLAQEQFVTYVAAPLVVKGQVKGVLELFHRAHLYLDAERLGFLEIFADQAAIAVENAELFQGLQHSNAELRQAYDATIEGWSRALDLRDKETEGHTRRVTEMTMRLARALGMTDDELVHVRRGALLHDIGKMGVPDGILLKPGPLTAEEWSVMRQHPQLAYDMLAPIAFLWPALEIPYCHHEKWDGTGYPRGLAGDAIPLAARLFAVADVWDALRSDRPYRPAWPVARVVDYIRAEAGRQFDPRVVDVFLKLVLEP
ncbi:MAG: PAS domain S-box protein, partial [Anaerolineales bacterium]|nr:PAS domain S-box protein [Anaerolineales bacterium]